MGYILSEVEELPPVVKKRKVVADNTDKVEWVHIGKLSLKQSDKLELLKEEELNNLHVNAAQYLLAKQFPMYMGFKSTLLQQHIGSWTNNFIQIVHCLERHHCVTISTVGCISVEVKVYDTFFRDVDENTKDKLKRFFLAPLSSRYQIFTNKMGLKTVAYMP